MKTAELKELLKKVALTTALLCMGITVFTGCAKNPAAPKLYYQGHASVRITTPENKVIYVDPYTGDGYDAGADLILITHGHQDHNKTQLITNRNEDCQIITHEEAVTDDGHQSFDLGFVKIDAVQAQNKNHDPAKCVGYVLTFSNGVQLYLSGDTSATEQMGDLKARKIDYAFFCTDGTYNMNIEEAAQCAKLMGAKHNTPYHLPHDKENPFDRSFAESFAVDGLLVVAPGETIALE